MSVAAQRSRTASVHATSNPAATTLREARSLITAELLQVAEEIRVIIPKGVWHSYGSEEEIRRQNESDTFGAPPIQRRPPMTLQYEVPRSVLLRQRHSAHQNYITKEASEDCRDLRSVPNPMYDVMRDEVEVGVQAIPARTSMATQTRHARQVNAVAQTEAALVDACISHVGPPKTEAPNLSAFLDRALPRTLHYLTQNYEVPIYTDDFQAFNDDDAVLATRDELVLVEKGNFIYSSNKDKRVSCVSWRSSRRQDHCVCIASVAALSLKERIRSQRRCDSSISLVWELSDPMHPRYLLESPNEVQVLHFHPTRPNIVAGGAINGQVYLWDLSLADTLPFLQKSGGATKTANQHHRRAAPTEDPSAAGGKAAAAASAPTAVEGSDDPMLNAAFREVCEIPPMVSSVKGVGVNVDGDVRIPTLQPIQISRVEVSHQGPVHDLQWMQQSLEFSFDGKQAVVEETHQFATVSDDGAVLIWDIRPEFLPQDKLRKIKHQSRGTGREQPWVPLLRYQLNKPDAVGESMLGFHFHVNGLASDETPSYSVAVGTTDGEIGFCDMVMKHERRPSVVVPTFGFTKETRFVRTVVPYAHAGPVYCVQRHPTIGDVYLSCGDSCFKVWRTGLMSPLYESPQRPASVTCAAWSPARAGLVFIGTSEGTIEIWDILDRNSEPILTHSLVQDAVTCIEFKPLPSRLNATYNQPVLIGTKLGSFHWYVLPAALSRAPSGEARHLRSALEREVRRVAYYDWRWSERQSEMDRYGPQGAAARLRGAAKFTASITDKNNGHGNSEEDEEKKLLQGKEKPMRGKLDDADDSNPYTTDPQRDQEFLDLVERLDREEMERMKAEPVT